VNNEDCVVIVDNVKVSQSHTILVVSGRHILQHIL